MWKFFSVWMTYRTLLHMMKAEAKAKANLKHGCYRQAIYWFHALHMRAGDTGISNVVVRVTEWLEPHLPVIFHDRKIIVGRFGQLTDKQLIISVSMYMQTQSIIIPFTQTQMLGITCDALQIVGGLRVAKKALAILGRDIPDQQLLEYGKMCRQQGNDYECQKACALVKNMTAEKAFEACGADTL